MLGRATAAVSVRLEEDALLLDESGSVIVPVGTYADIVRLDDERFAAGSQDGYALMDAQGRLLTGMDYDELRIAGGMIAARSEQGWQLMDRAGTPAGAQYYTSIVAADDGGFWALRPDEYGTEAQQLWIIGADGSARATGLMLQHMDDRAGDGLIAVADAKTGLWGYVDSEGAMAVPAVYSHAGCFVSGCAPVVQEGRYGALNTGGELCVPAEYDFLQVSPSGFILAAAYGRGVYVFGTDGDMTASYEGGDLFGMLAGDGYAVAAADQLQVYNAKGEIIARDSGSAAVYNGLSGQVIISDGAWGEKCVYLSGTEEYWQNIYPLGMAGGKPVYACMEANVARYMNDMLGEIQIAVDMDSVRYGVIGAGGTVLIDCDYRSIEYLTDDRLLVRTRDQWLMIDTRGSVYWAIGAIPSEEASFGGFF